jgi:hypothetical protein
MKNPVTIRRRRREMDEIKILGIVGLCKKTPTTVLHSRLRGN